jgi:curved DNA-binding protein
MTTRQSIVNYYEVLQISPNADQEIIERTYRFLAKRYHPDNAVSGNDEKFRILSEAYRALSDPEKRAGYDAKTNGHENTRLDLFDKDSECGDTGTDRRIQQAILSLLYQTRRRDAQNAGIGIFEMEKVLTVPEKHLEFHIWYLKEKSWIRRTDTGQYEITASGVDALIQNNTSATRDQFLLKASNS